MTKQATAEPVNITASDICPESADRSKHAISGHTCFRCKGVDWSYGFEPSKRTAWYPPNGPDGTPGHLRTAEFMRRHSTGKFKRPALPKPTPLKKLSDAEFNALYQDNEMLFGGIMPSATHDPFVDSGLARRSPLPVLIPGGTTRPARLDWPTAETDSGEWVVSKVAPGDYMPRHRASGLGVPSAISHGGKIVVIGDRPSGNAYTAKAALSLANLLNSIVSLGSMGANGFADTPDPAQTIADFKAAMLEWAGKE